MQTFRKLPMKAPPRPSSHGTSSRGISMETLPRDHAGRARAHGARAPVVRVLLSIRGNRKGAEESPEHEVAQAPGRTPAGRPVAVDRGADRFHVDLDLERARAVLRDLP